MSKILVVDDEPTIVELIEETLGLEGYETTHAFSGEEALELMEKDAPDLVLLDIMLPGMDGYEVCRQMQHNPQLAHVPVIMLTAKSATADKVAGYDKGADDYITKPFDAEELLVRVRAQLHHLYHEEISELTGLPGSKAVEEAIRQKTQRASEPWAIIYVDIDNLDVYNEVYSFIEGDELIRLAGRVVLEAVRAEGQGSDFIGHVGGDNFVIVTAPDRAETIMAAARRLFGERVGDYYSPTDRQQGYVTSINHAGERTQTPLAALSFDVVNNVP